ncbi:phage integrase N-terminal SAM-like domain-containing protein [Paracidovorax avenae]|uniref:phage integrase N-terminal SAM-like domain-containing protein n=1 Tax=Paracidovorax avenae TaxID=80867 RepID=UPI003369CD4A
MLRATRLLDQVRGRIRYKHYSLRTEQACVQWVHMFVKWNGLRHPRDMGAAGNRRFSSTAFCPWGGRGTPGQGRQGSGPGMRQYHPQKP